jgi:hypothetical protein
MEHFDGVPVWHASASLRSRKPVADWTRGERREAERVLMAALRGVGREPTMPELGTIALHWRRWVTEREAVRVGEPRDIRGTAEEQRRLAAIRFVLQVHGVTA